MGKKYASRVLDLNSFTIAFAAILIAVVLGLSAYIYHSTKQRIVGEHLSRMDSETVRLVSDVNNRISTLSLAIGATAKHITQDARSGTGASLLGELRPYLVDITRDMDSLRTIVVVDPMGVVTDDLRPEQPALGISVHDRKYFRVHADGLVDGIFVADPVVSRVDGKWTWPLSVAAKARAGDLLAVVVSSVDIRYFGGILSRPVSARETESLIVHANGTVLHVSRQLESKIGGKIQDTSLIDAASEQGAVLLEAATGPFGRLNLVASAMKVGDWPVFVVNLLDRTVIERKLMMWWWAMILFSGTTCLMILAAMLLQVWHNRHRTITEGALRANEQELSELNRTLEARVEERTAELRAAQEELVRSERLATLGQLTATVSHELRNPLGAMRTSLHIVEKVADKKDRRLARSIDRINRSIIRCDNIIDELLDFTRVLKMITQPTPLDAWLADILDELAAPEGVVVVRQFGLPEVTLSMDPDRMRRAVINVYENACQAVSGETETARVAVSTRTADGRVEICIEDNGPGIPADVLPRIFEPLYSTKNFGVGLGLAIVKQIMEQHGGGIETDTAPGRGTRFTLWLPFE